MWTLASHNIRHWIYRNSKNVADRGLVSKDLPIGNGLWGIEWSRDRWSMTSLDPERSNSWSQYTQSGPNIFENSWRCYLTTIANYRIVCYSAGIMWTEDESLCDLDFADDIALIIDDSWNSMQQTTSTLTKEANKVGLYINVDKCKLWPPVFGTTDRTYRLQVQK